MQISQQDIRCVGYSKIINHFIVEHNIVEIIKEHNSEVADFRVSSYGVLARYSFLRNKAYKGFDSFVQNIDPFAGIHKSTDASKRSFRQGWDGIWRSLVKINSISDSEAKILNEFGIRLAYIVEGTLKIEVSDDELSVIVDFYDCMLSWFGLCKTEDNLKQKNISPVDMLMLLSINNFEEFKRACMERKFKVC